MTDIAEKLSAEGISLNRYTAGNQKIVCPKCSHGRRNKGEPCLSVKIDGDGAAWNCHHCQWSGGVKEGGQSQPRYRQERRPPPARPTKQAGDLTPEAIAWFAARRISEATVRRNRIGLQRTYLPGLNGEVDCLAFPYLRNGETVNLKFRALGSKDFAQVKGAEKILYGLDDIADVKTAIIVEGEPDKLALEEAGFRNAVSVPDGAPKTVKAEAALDDRKFEYLANCEAQLARLEKIILAVDADGPGEALEEELARRLGKERCWRVRWPEGSKDANDVLLLHGPEVLAACVASAEAYPIAGLHGIDDFTDELLALYRDGHQRGHSTGWDSVDELMTVRPGELSIVTGVPGSGKSEFVDALMSNLADRHGWRFAICSFENPPADHIAKLVEKRLGLPFYDGPTPLMTEAELLKAAEWVKDHFHLIRADDEAPTIDLILGAAKAAVLRYGIRGLVIDPYNEIEHRRPSSQTETEYVSELLSKVKRFAQRHGVHVWFVAHPAKLYRSKDSDKTPIPGLYDISGSANWVNKADLGIVVHRDFDGDPTRTEIHIRKVRFKSVGKVGVVKLRYDRPTGRYSEITAAAGGSGWSQAMSAAQILRSALNAGVTVRLAGNDLALKAAAVPPVEVRDLLARHKAEIIAFLRHGEGSWKAEDWRAFFDERAGIAEFDNGLSRPDAEARAFACCVSEWLVRNPAVSPAGHCLGCGKGEQGTPAILPYGTQKAGFAWLHADCWPAWHDRRVANAIAALSALGIVPPAGPEAVP